MASTDPQSPSPICTDSNWSAANAWWFLFPLALSCLAQPRGSLLFHRSRRFWRCSPAQLLAEDLCIIYRLYQGYLPYRAPRRGWGAFRICCHAILALREGNVWGEKEYDDFFSRNENVQYVEGDGDGIGGLPVADNGSSSASGFHDVHSFGSGMSYRSPSSQLGHVIELEPQSSDLGIPHSSSDIQPRPSLVSLQDWFSGEQLTPEKLDALLRIRFRYNLSQVQMSERGPSYRFLLWLPMVQQSIKLLPFVVSGAPFTKTVALIYLFSFLLVEAMHLSTKKRLSALETSQALDLMSRWGKMKQKTHIPGVDQQGAMLEPRGMASHGSIYTSLGAIINLTAIMFIYNLRSIIPSIFRWFLSKLPTMGEFFPLEGTPWIIVLMFPINLMFSYWILLRFLLLVSLLTPLVFLLTGPLIYLGSSPYFVARWISRITEDRESDRFVASAVGIQTLVLMFFWYLGFGILSGLKFDCSSTWKCGVYDWLG